MKTTGTGIESEREARNIILTALKEEMTKDLAERFSALDVVALSSEGKLSAQARYRRLEECLIKTSDQMRSNRADTRSLLSARHFATFFWHACDHFARTIKEPLDFVQTSRLRNPVSVNLDKHLSHFLKNIKSPHELTEFAVPVISSSILLDRYPPGHACTAAFEPGEVFRTLYKDVCYQVRRTGVLVHDGSTDLVLPSGFVKMVAGQLERSFEKFIQDTGTPSATVHSENLQNFKRYWRRIRIDDLCLTCLHWDSEYTLPCGRSVCENCAVVFREGSEHDRWVFEIHNCFLCGVKLRDVTVKVKFDIAFGTM